MKKDTHPKYQKVLFVDSASGYRFVCGSSLQPDAKEVFEGVEYPVSYLSISSSSHPFFTGSKQLVDSEGRVEKFKKRFDKRSAKFINEDAPVGEAPQKVPPKAASATAKAPAPKAAASKAPAPKATTDKKAAPAKDDKKAEKPAKEAAKKAKK